MNQKEEKSIELYTPKHINELKLYNAVLMKESSEMVRNMPPDNFTDSYYFKYYDFTLKEHKEKEILFDMPFGNDQDLPIINELHLNFAIDSYISSNDESKKIKDETRRNKIKTRLDFLVNVVDTIIDWFIDNNYPLPSCYDNYPKKTQQIDRTSNNKGRPIDPMVEVNKNQLRAWYYELRHEQGLGADGSVDILEKEFSQLAYGNLIWFAEISANHLSTNIISLRIIGGYTPLHWLLELQ